MEIATDIAEDYVDITFGDNVRMTPDALSTLIKAVTEATGFTPTRANADFNRTTFSTGKDYKVYADKIKLDYESANWSQDD